MSFAGCWGSSATSSPEGGGISGDASGPDGTGDGATGADAGDGGVDAGGSGEIEIFSTGSGRVCPSALALDDDSIFWLASPPRTATGILRGTELGRIAKQGGLPAILARDDRWPRAIAADDMRIYFSVEGDVLPLGAVLAVEKRGGDLVALAPFPAGSLAADSSGLYLSTNFGTPPGIYVVRPGATAPVHLAGGTEPSGVDGIAVDATFVYWPEGEQLLRAPKAGGAAAALWGPAEGGIGSLLVAVSDEEVYWHDGSEWVRKGPAAGGQSPTRLARYSLWNLSVARRTVFGLVASGPDSGRIVRIDGDGSATAMATRRVQLVDPRNRCRQ